VEAATEEYRRESDIFGQWLSDCAVTDRGQFLLASEAYSSFRDWCKAHGYKEPTENSLGRSMVEKGFKKVKNRQGKRGYEDVRLVPIL
jgi:phage/plasmid-associated DNA primase